MPFKRSSSQDLVVGLVHFGLELGNLFQTFFWSLLSRLEGCARRWLDMPGLAISDALARLS